MNKNEDYRKRLFEEYNQLKQRYANLCLFLAGDTKLKAADFVLMHEQKEIMEDYIKILERRIENLEDFKRYETIILHHTGLIKNKRNNKNE